MSNKPIWESHEYTNWHAARDGVVFCAFMVVIYYALVFLCVAMHADPKCGC